MKTILLILLSTACLAQDLYVKVADVPSLMINKGAAYYDTLPKGTGVVYRLLITDYGLRDTTKQIIVKYETSIIDAVPDNEQPVAQIDTVDSEALTYTGWARHGATSAPGWHAGTISYSSTGEASYTFTGTRVQIFGETKPSDGTGTVTIGDKTVTAQYNKAQVLPAMVFDSGVMPRGNHTMTLKPVSGSVNLDFLVITR